MTFFLLARDTEGRLVLLSDTTFDSRNVALAALGRLTADPDFAFEGSELFVLDLEEATPVLLVRPTAAPSDLEPLAEEEIEAAADLEQDADLEALISAVAEDLDSASDLDEEAPALIEEELIVEELIVEQVVADHMVSDVDATDLDELLVDDAVASLSDEPPVVMTEQSASVPLEPYPAEAEFVEPASAPEETSVDAAVAEAVIADAESVANEAEATTAQAGASLRDALERTTVSMESQGITAPEPVPAAEATWPWGESAAGSAELPTPEPALAAEPVADTDSAPEPVAEPSEDFESLGEVEPEPEAGLAAEASPVVFDPLEEPAVDATPLVHTVLVEESVEIEAADELPAPDTAEAPQGVVVDAEISDFILDIAAAEDGEPPVPVAESFAAEPTANLDQAPPIEFEHGAPVSAGGPTDETPASAAPFQSDLATLTCEDCVYVATCPNKGQLDPTTCGSFQWKSL